MERGRKKKFFLLLDKVAKKDKIEDMLFDLEIGFLHRMLWVILFVHMYSKVSSYINISTITDNTITIINIMNTINIIAIIITTTTITTNDHHHQYKHLHSTKWITSKSQFRYSLVLIRQSNWIGLVCL